MTQAPPPYHPPQPSPPQPNYAQPQGGPPQKVKPSAIWYLIALLLLLGGAGLAVAMGWGTVVELVETFDSIEHMRAPGELAYSCPEAGEYAVYFVGPDAANQRRQQQAQPALSVTVRHAETGEPIEMTTLEGENLTVNDESFRALRGFAVDGPTKVIVTVTATNGTVEPAPMAVGPKLGVSELMGMMGGIFAAVAAAGGGFVLGLIVFLVTIIRRSSSKSRIRQAQPF